MDVKIVFVQTKPGDMMSVTPELAEFFEGDDIFATSVEATGSWNITTRQLLSEYSQTRGLTGPALQPNPTSLSNSGWENKVPISSRIPAAQ